MTRMKKLTNAARKEISMNAAISTVFLLFFMTALLHGLPHFWPARVLLRSGVISGCCVKPDLISPLKCNNLRNQSQGIAFFFFRDFPPENISETMCVSIRAMSSYSSRRESTSCTGLPCQIFLNRVFRLFKLSKKSIIFFLNSVPHRAGGSNSNTHWAKI